jgi:hypothetical protein
MTLDANLEWRVSLRFAVAVFSLKTFFSSLCLVVFLLDDDEDDDDDEGKRKIFLFF